MKPRTKAFILTASIIFGATPLLPAGAEEIEWPHWAGPNRDGSVLTTGSVSKTGIFQEPFELHERWRQPVGGGVSALIVAGGRIVSLEGRDERDVAFALDGESGKELWRVDLGPSLATQHEFGITTTPASDGRWVVLVSPGCLIRGLEAATGKEVWRYDLRAEYTAGTLSYGCFTSPLIEGDRAFIQVHVEPEKRVMAFDLASGTVVWSATGVRRARRSSPTITTLGGVRQIVVHDIKNRNSGLYGLRASDGELLWNITLPKIDQFDSFSYDMPFALAGDRVALAIWSELVVIEVRRQADKFAATFAWRTHDIRAGGVPVNLHALAHGDYVYGFGGEYLQCLEASTGKSMWRERIYPGSLIVVDGHLVVLSQAAGLLRIVEATPAGYREKLRQQVFVPGAPADTPPSFAGDRLYLRNSDEIVVFEVMQKGKAQP